MNELLNDVRTLQQGLLALSESQVQRLLDTEMNSRKPRKLAIERLHQRLCILRGKRERASLFKQAGIE